MTKFKVFSHGQRLLDNARISRNFQKYKYPTGVQKTFDEVSIEDGVKVTKSTTKMVKFKDMNRGLKWYDYSIDSLEISGAIGMLNSSQLVSNPLTQADILIDNANVIEANLNNNKVK